MDKPKRQYIIIRGIPWYYTGMKVTMQDLKRYYTDEAIRKFREDGYFEPEEKCCYRCDGIDDICVTDQYED